MGKINLENIKSSLGKAKEAASPLQGKGHTENVPVEYIHPSNTNIFNETDTDESIQALADDIETNGLIHPIAVNKIAKDNYQILSGERRFRAMTEYLHRKVIPCMVFENLSEEEAQLRLCMANLSVREYTTSQKFKFYREVKSLLEKMKSSGQYKGGMQKGIAQLLNVTERQVRNYGQIEKLPEDLQQDVIEGRISFKKAMELADEKEKQNDGKKTTEEGTNEALMNILSSLSEEQKALILSGEVNLSQLFASDSSKGGITLVKTNEDTPQETVAATNPEEEKAEPDSIFEKPSDQYSNIQDTDTTSPALQEEKAETFPIFETPSEQYSSNQDTETASPAFQEEEKAETFPIFEEPSDQYSNIQDTETASPAFQEEEKAETFPIFEEPSDQYSSNQDTDTASPAFQKEEKAEPTSIFEAPAEQYSSNQDTDTAVPAFQEDIPSDSEKGYIIHKGKKYPIDRVFIVKDRDDVIIFKAYVNKE